jgi:Flp pilus assembly pilin Flp
MRQLLKVRSFLRATAAQDLVEYALIVAVIALASIPVISGLRYALSALYSRQADAIHQNLATPQRPAQTPATKAIPAGPQTPAEAAHVSAEPSGALNTGLMATVYWAVQRFVRFVGVIVIITIGLLYASSRRDATHLPLSIFRPLKMAGGAPFLSRNEPKITLSSLVSFIGYMLIAALALWIAFR